MYTQHSHLQSLLQNNNNTRARDLIHIYGIEDESLNIMRAIRYDFTLKIESLESVAKDYLTVVVVNLQKGVFGLVI